jgi:hypothetical protein
VTTDPGNHPALNRIRQRIDGTPALRAFPDHIADVERLLAIAEKASHLYVPGETDLVYVATRQDIHQLAELIRDLRHERR